MSGRQVLVVGTMALVLAGAVAACGGDEKSSQDATETTTTTSDAAQAAASPPGDAAAATQTPEEVLEYWTPEREASARPFSVTAPEETDFNPAATTEPSAESAVDGVPPPGEAGGAQPGLLSGDFDWKVVRKPYTDPPFKSTGVLYFNRGAQKDFSCSATAVGTPNESVVWTAGHCLYWGGKWSSSVKFVPGYYSAPGSSRQEKPFGSWAARPGLMWVPQGWVDTAKKDNGAGVEWSLDVAAIVVGRRSGKTLVDTVGAQGIVWTGAPGRIVDLGYPANPSPPFRFGPQYLCVSPVFPSGEAGIHAIDCDFGEGASGGPWIEDYQAARGWGYIRSVNSFGQPETSPDTYFGPRLGKAAENIYNTAKNK